ncbi:NAD(P)H-binding protein [Peteryoungia desertarenae]|uniref:Divinyl chlorophyllide a 8-vinyl-reductase, chloroplastic n=1 Tax=Peteryoungia desertarenae TaxID=1813451 RepID=A0ABX6QL34_9HYPH|nr:NAD(P)H-binding protein [Peteryoungia desertarenae]
MNRTLTFNKDGGPGLVDADKTARRVLYGAPVGKRVCVVGATGTIGRATVSALVRHGHDVVCLLRSNTANGAAVSGNSLYSSLDGVSTQIVDFDNSRSLAEDGFSGRRLDAVISCMASRTGTPKDAWAVDYHAQSRVLQAAKQAGVGHFVLLSAICVQKPLLEFQKAKLAFEAELIRSGLRYSIVRPTAFFKSLSGQIERVRQGKAFLLFGNGMLTACKPISDRDLANYLTDCLENEERWDRILPIGGPGDAITPREQGEALFSLMGRTPKFRSVPIAMLDVIIGGLGALGRIAPKLSAKAELARIGRYYATESMLVLDPKTGLYDEAATPSTGQDTLFDFYRSVLDGGTLPERGDHAVF